MQKREVFQKSKKIGEIILCIWKWVIVSIYAILVGTFIYRAVSFADTWRYPSYSVPNILCVIGIFGVLPIGVIIFLFYKKKNLRIFVSKIILQVVMLFFLYVMGIYTLLFNSSVSMSYTTDPEHYFVVDDGVKEAMKTIGLNILPEEIPQEAENVKYLYRVAAVIDTELELKASWQYTDKKAYERAKEILAEREVEDTYKEDGYIKHQIYTDREANTENRAIFGYDDTSMSVMYEIKGVW